MNDHLKKLLLEIINQVKAPEQLVALLNLSANNVVDLNSAKDIIKKRKHQSNQQYESLSDIPVIREWIEDHFDELIASEFYPSPGPISGPVPEPIPELIPRTIPGPIPGPIPGQRPGPTPNVSRPNDHPVLLLPIRLETRFKEGSLLIRIYPDQVSVNTHEPRLTTAELKAGREYVDAESKQDAWRELSRKISPERAAWIVKLLEEVGESDPEIREDVESWLTIPKLMALPDRFVAYLIDENGLMQDPIVGVPVNKNITLFSAQSTNEELFDDDSKWMVDFERAEADGMGINVAHLSANPERLIKRIIVVGLGSSDVNENQQVLEKLLDAHHYATGMEFLKSYTPTNNTQNVSSGHSDSTENHENSYEIEIEGPKNWNESPDEQRSSAQRLGYALGLGVRPEKLRYLANAGDTSDSYAKEMQTALWPATGDYYFRYLLPGILSPEGENKLAQHFINHVRANGPLPTIRIGDQPYGVLPVTKVRGFIASSRDNLHDGEDVEFDNKLNRVLSGLFEEWFTLSDDSRRVPRVDEEGDPDQQLLQILSMEPVSLSYRARPFVDERLIAWLLVAMRDSVFGPDSPYYSSVQSPLHWVNEWANEWYDYRFEVAEEWNTTTSISTEQLEESPLMGLFGWWNDRDIELDADLGITKKEYEEESEIEPELPGDYLRMLCDRNDIDVASKTLLKDLLRRSLILAPDSSISIQTVRDAICNMATVSLLDFFNTVTRPEQITQRIKDDPGFGSGSPRAYGVRKTLAQRILNARAALDNDVFTSIEQIDDVFGVGTDTLHDIIYAFRDKSPKPDVDSLLRGTLDLLTHRLDSWITAFATKRLKAMREERPAGLYIGAYGWVENLSPNVETQSEGYIHAPSRGQAAAAAVMHNAYLTHKNEADANPFRINLNSHRVRKAFRTMEGIRQGQPLGALLGYQFERGLHENHLDEYIYDIRSQFPLVANKETPAEVGDTVEAVAASNVVDGLALVRWWQESNAIDLTDLDAEITNEQQEQQIIEHIKGLLDSLDAVSDVLMYEGVYQAAQGNYERGGAALEAAAGNATPPEIESLMTPVKGKSLAHRVCLVFREELEIDVEESTNPRVIAEPRIAGWLNQLIPNLNSIGCNFKFRKININTSSKEELVTLPGLDEVIASAIIQYRDRHGEFKFLYQIKKVFRKVDGIIELLIDEILFNKLVPWIMIGIEDDESSLYYRRTNINSVTAPELSNLKGFEELADEIITNRDQDGEFSSVDELSDRVGVDQVVIDANRIWLTAGEDVVSLDDLDIDVIDIMYMSTTIPQGEDTEIEQRIRLFIRNKYNLPYDTFLKLDTARINGFEFSINEVFELCSYIFNALATGSLLKPGLLSLPAENAAVVFTQDNVNKFNARLDEIIRLACVVITKLGGDAILDNNGDPICNVTDVANTPDEIVDALFEASHFGIIGAIPAALNDPELENNKQNVVKELTRRSGEFNKLRSLALTDPANDTEVATLPDKKMDLLIKATKVIFAGSFIIMPVYTPNNSANLTNAFSQKDLLAEHDEIRIRLWIQQVAQVHPPVNSMEDMLLMTEAWQQSLTSGSQTLLPLKVAQLPVRDGATWLALDDENIHGTDDYGRGALSIVAMVAGQNDADFSTNNLAGIMLDQWDELIPSDIIDTSVGFHFNAPNTQAPQALLLAVPGSRGQAPQDWTEDELAEIVYDTLDLAKVRAVDIDAMREIDGDDSFSVGALLPGLMLPTDPDNPGWARNAFADSIQDWVDNLSGPYTCLDFNFIFELFSTVNEELIFGDFTFYPAVSEEIFVHGYTENAQNIFPHDLVLLYKELNVDLSQATDTVILQIGIHINDGFNIDELISLIQGDMISVFDENSILLASGVDVQFVHALGVLVFFNSPSVALFRVTVRSEGIRRVELRKSNASTVLHRFCVAGELNYPQSCFEFTSDRYEVGDEYSDGLNKNGFRLENEGQNNTLLIMPFPLMDDSNVLYFPGQKIIIKCPYSVSSISIDFSDNQHLNDPNDITEPVIDVFDHGNSELVFSNVNIEYIEQVSTWFGMWHNWSAIVDAYGIGEIEISVPSSCVIKKVCISRDH